MECALCNMEMKRHMQKILDGCICKDCMGRLPHSIHKNIMKYSRQNLATIVDYMGNLQKKQFVPTASFGSLHIDEIHGLFVVQENLKDNFVAEELTDMFYCLSLKEVGLTPTNVAVDKSNQVTCDFELHCWFEYPECSFVVPVRKKVKCPTKRKNKSELTYEMPGDYQIFLKMFNQMIETAKKKYEEESEGKFLSQPAFLLFKAETMYMLGDGYDRDDVERQKDTLLSAFEGQAEYESLIMQAYHILMNRLEGEYE